MKFTIIFIVLILVSNVFGQIPTTPLIDTAIGTTPDSVVYLTPPKRCAYNFLTIRSLDTFTVNYDTLLVGIHGTGKNLIKDVRLRPVGGTEDSVTSGDDISGKLIIKKNQVYHFLIMTPNVRDVVFTLTNKLSNAYRKLEFTWEGFNY